ncbi:Cytochrome b [hydrothermal vent metagenome]|uniref:Cytochrome b n=1 Tax=hydrothermal vent metagenome TaxID=652676 RepID=A0A3B1BYQ8_9ZZZZ
MNRSETIQVWDPLVRLFHWTLVLAFSIAFITEEDYLRLHSIAGYSVIGLLAFRLLWGLCGPRYARFKDFVYSPAHILKYLKHVMRNKSPRYLGHNPAGGAMIILLLVALALTTVTGLAVYAAGDNAGPLAAWLGHAGEDWAETFEALHEFFANFTVLLVVVHISGVLFESLLHRENLMVAMFTGNKVIKLKNQRGVS